MYRNRVGGYEDCATNDCARIERRLRVFYEVAPRTININLFKNKWLDYDSTPGAAPYLKATQYAALWFLGFAKQRAFKRPFAEKTPTTAPTPTKKGTAANGQCLFYTHQTPINAPT